MTTPWKIGWLAVCVAGMIQSPRVVLGERPPPLAEMEAFRREAIASTAIPGRVMVPSSLLVKYRPGAPVAAAGAVRRGRCTTLRRYPLVPGLEHVWTALPVEKALAELRADPWVEFAEPDYILRKSTTPNDPLFGLQWGLQNLGQVIRSAAGTVDADMDMPEAWDLGTGASDMVIADLDTGIQGSHPDLAANLWTNPGEIPGNGVDDDGNGYVDDVHGWDFFSDDNNPEDEDGHGTHTAGTIGAAGNNGIGVTGVAWRCKIMPLRFLGPGGGTISDAVDALNYAVAMGVRVSNNSWGGSDFSQALYEAIRNARAHGHVFVAAAGNSGADTGLFPEYPAAFDLDNILSVAAIDCRDQLATFSSFGAVTVDLAAPGVDVASTYLGGGYAWASGTSMAAPHAAGVVALLFQRFPTLTCQQAIGRILACSRPVPALKGKCVTGGALNARAALEGGFPGGDGVVRREWMIGVDANPAVLPYRPYGEFSSQNNRNDVAPGQVTRLPGDSQYVAAANPGADDDFYFAGLYPAGFNRLTAPLWVPNDEPPIAWEHSHTVGDRTNRMHFLLTADQAGAAVPFRLSFEFAAGGTSIGGVSQPGFGSHDMVVRFRNGAGVDTVIYSQRLSAPTNIVLEFTAAAVAAMAGPNTIEIVRTGPAVTGVSYYVVYDYLRLEQPALANARPVFPSLGDVAVDEETALSLDLRALDADVPQQVLTYSLVNGPPGMTVSSLGTLRWTPTEAQGPGTYAVTVQVVDNGIPSMGDAATFQVRVNEVPDATVRREWMIGVDANPAVLPYRPYGEFSSQNNRNDVAPGQVTRLPGDSQYVAAANPGADDDFYFAGLYPAGFNRLTAPLWVPNDEPPIAWEHSHTVGDRTNRMHFLLTADQAGAAVPFRLSFEFAAGGTSIGGVSQPGFGSHDMVVRFRNGAGVDTVIYSQRLSAPTNIVLEFTAAAVAAMAGPNTIEIVRTGPAVTGVSYYVVYDYLRLEQLALPIAPAAGPSFGGGAVVMPAPQISFRFSDAGSRFLEISGAGDGVWFLEAGSDLVSWTEIPTVVWNRNGGTLTTVVSAELLDQHPFWRVRQR